MFCDDGHYGTDQIQLGIVRLISVEAYLQTVKHIHLLCDFMINKIVTHICKILLI